MDQYHEEVEDLMSVILDGRAPRLDLASSRGNVATLVALDQAARDNVAMASARDAS